MLERKLAKSRESIARMLSLSKNPYLALSFGKDSLAMLDLVLEQYPDVPCLFLKSEETFLLHEYEKIIGEYLSRGLRLSVVEMRHHNHDFSEGAANNEFAQRAFFWDDKGSRWDGVFMGLRIDESKARRHTLLAKQNNLYGHRIMRYSTGLRAGMYRCCPVADWTAAEVMYFLEERALTFLSAYEEGAHVRTSAQLPFENQLDETVADLKRRNPEGYNKLIQLIPTLRNP